MILRWLRSLRRAETATADEIRRRLVGLQAQRDRASITRDSLALDAVNLQSAAEQYQRLTDVLAQLDAQIQLLAAALPAAEEREAEAARQAEAAALEKRMDNFDSMTAEVRSFVDPILARLVTGEELTQARDLRDRLSQEARFLTQRSRDARFRRPTDPLHEIQTALAHRVARIDRARWIGSSPITLKEKSE